jgi:4-hydroxymandelate oxidase
MNAAQALVPREILCAADSEVLVPQFLPGPIHAYIAGGRGQDLTVAFNRDTFAIWAIFPRLQCDVTGGTTQLDLAGVTLPHPVLLAPVAFQKLADPRGELEIARAAAATQTCMVASTLSTSTLEEISALCGPQRWFQLYFQLQGRAATLALVRRAQEAGYTAIVVTLDASIQAASLRSLRAGFTMPADCIAANLQAEAADQAPPVKDGESRIFQSIMRAAAAWPELEWLLARTTLPLWVKGVLHPDDAVRLKRLGVAGLVVSNHGGRSLDGAPASLDALPAIRAAVDDGFPLLLDGGIRSGSDVFKALALGADAVMVGRLQMCALAVAGALGVAHMLKLLREELEVCMALAGCARLEDITLQALTPVPAAGRIFVKDKSC